MSYTARASVSLHVFTHSYIARQRIHNNKHPLLSECYNCCPKFEWHLPSCNRSWQAYVYIILWSELSRKNRVLILLPVSIGSAPNPTRPKNGKTFIDPSLREPCNISAFYAQANLFQTGAKSEKNRVLILLPVSARLSEGPMNVFPGRTVTGIETRFCRRT